MTTQTAPVTPPTPRRTGPPAKPFPAGTVQRMDALLAGGLGMRERERVQCIRLLALGRTAPDVAQVIGRSLDTVYRHKREFLARGEAALRATGWGGRRSAVLGEAEEAEFVASFEQAARDGELVTARTVLEALAQRTGRRVDSSTIYRMLERHGWRKVVPRPAHPDADPGRREAFKETSPSWSPPRAAGTNARCG